MEGSKVMMIENKDYAMWGITIGWTVVLMYTGLFKSAESFLKVDVIMNAMNGIVWLAMPAGLLKSLISDGVGGKVDGGHMCLAYMSGVLLFYTCAIVWVCTTAEENTVTTSILWSKLILAVLYIVVEINYFCQHISRSVDGAWTTADITFSLCVMILAVWIACAVVQLRRFDQWGGYPEHTNRLNAHIRLDYVVALVVGLCLFAYPDLVLKYTNLSQNHDAVHVYLSRAAGVMVIHSALITGSAPKFLLEMPKVRLLFCRLVMCILLTAVYLITMSSHGLLTISAVPRILVLPSLWGFNALSGYLFSRYGQLK